MTQITLATLAQATPQQVFEQAVLGVLRQGMRSWDGDSSIFKDDHGNASPAGHLMTAEECAALETVWGTDESWFDLGEMGGVPAVHRELIEALELAHDKQGEACLELLSVGGAPVDAASETDARFIELFFTAAVGIAGHRGLSVDALSAPVYVVESETPTGYRNTWTVTEPGDVRKPLTFPSVFEALDAIGTFEQLALGQGREPGRVRIAVAIAAPAQEAQNPSVDLAVEDMDAAGSAPGL